MEEEIPPRPGFPETSDEVRQRDAKLLGKVTYLEGLDRTHRAIGALLKEDKARVEMRNASSYPSVLDEPLFGSPYERRRLRLVNSIFSGVGEGEHPGPGAFVPKARRGSRRGTHERWRRAGHPKSFVYRDRSTGLAPQAVVHPNSSLDSPDEPILSQIASLLYGALIR